MAIGVRVGDSSGYEIDRGARVDCPDSEAWHGLAMLCWSDPTTAEEARALLRSIDPSLALERAEVSVRPSLADDGWVEALVTGAYDTSALVERLERAGARALGR